MDVRNRNLSDQCLLLSDKLTDIVTDDIKKYVQQFDFNYETPFIRNVFLAIDNVKSTQCKVELIGYDNVFLHCCLKNKLSSDEPIEEIWKQLIISNDFINYYYQLFQLSSDEINLLNQNNMRQYSMGDNMTHDVFKKINDNVALFNTITKPRNMFINGNLYDSMQLYTIKYMKTRVLILYNSTILNYIRTMSFNFGFMSSDVERQLILNKDVDKLSKYEIICDNIKTFILVNDTIKQIIMNNVNEIIKHQLIIKQLSLFLNNKTSKTINDQIMFYFVTTNASKQFPDGYVNMFNADIINSAEFSKTDYSGNDTINQLKIFRFEELYKVLFHELGHCYKLDKSFPRDKNILQNCAFESCTKDVGVNIPEIIAETFACVINILYISSQFKDSKKICKVFYNLEILFGIFQTAKILYLAKFNTIYEFIFKNTNNVLKQNTAATEYHILKTLCLIHFEEFLILNSSKNLDKFTVFINDKLRESEYCKCVDYFINHFKKYYVSNYSDILYNTARMTIIEQKLIY